MTSEAIEKIVPSDENPSSIAGILGTMAKFAGGYILGWLLIGFLFVAVALWMFAGFFWGQLSGLGWDGNAEITLGRGCAASLPS
jgi:hypothetical protein